MITVKINGVDAGLNTSRISRFTDLVELIKASIDPEHMITELKVDGREIDDVRWNSSISQQDSFVVEATSGRPVDFVADRLSQAASAVQACYIQFREARKSFQSGKMLDGNQSLIQAVSTAKAFFAWYATIMQLLPPAQHGPYDISSQVNDISEVCKKICQQQLYQSWWALGETLEKELEPKLDRLEDFCRRFVK